MSTATKPRKRMITVRGGSEWMSWLKGLQAHTELSQAELVDQSLRILARRVGYRIKPPRR